MARVLAHRGHQASLADPVFVWACRDILGAAVPRDTSDNAAGFIEELIRRVESGSTAPPEGEALAFPKRNGAQVPHLARYLAGDS
jgi:hypothetical protein